MAGLDLSALARELFLPGAIYTFVGAGGKTTAMRSVAAQLSRIGIRVLMTTTTRVGVEEFAGCPVSFAGSREQLEEAWRGREPVGLVVSAELPGRDKYAGVDPEALSALPMDPGRVLLVEGDGSRRRPLKVPTGREPVIPSASAMVIAVMGASGFDEPIDDEHCYNPDGARQILRGLGGSFDAPAIARLALHPAGCRKGVLPGMKFHLLLNQADLVDKRPTATRALRIIAEAPGMAASLVSLHQEVVYETTQP